MVRNMKEKKQDEMISRRDMIKRTASYTVFTAVTLHILAPKQQASASPGGDEVPGGVTTWGISEYNNE